MRERGRGFADTLGAGMGFGKAQRVAGIGGEQQQKRTAFEAIGKGRPRPIAAQDVGRAQGALDRLDGGAAAARIAQKAFVGACAGGGCNGGGG